MKKVIWVLTLFIYIIIISGCHKVEKSEPLDTSSPDYVYPEWRKTITSFGKRRRFAILRGTEFNEQEKIIGSNRWFLFDQQDNKSIDEEIDHRHKDIPPYVYTFGKNGYTKLNYDTGEFTQSKELSGFSEEDQEILKSITPGMYR